MINDISEKFVMKNASPPNIHYEDSVFAFVSFVSALRCPFLKKLCENCYFKLIKTCFEPQTNWAGDSNQTKWNADTVNVVYNVNRLYGRFLGAVGVPKIIAPVSKMIAWKHCASATTFVFDVCLSAPTVHERYFFSK